MAERVYKALAITEQGLTEEEKLTARTNIGAIGGVKVMDSTGTTELVPDAEGKVTVDLTNAGGTNADWAETNPAEKSFILNKPDLSVFATKTELTEGLAGKQNTLIAGENIVIDGDTISAVVPPGAFIGVYTGSADTNTPYADYLSAWQEGKPVFVKYTLSGGDIFMQMDQIDEDKVIFTRTIGYVADGVYGHVSNVLLRVASSDNSYTFYTTSLDPAVQQQSNWTEEDPSSPSFILNKPNLAAVAESGSYNDLTDKPQIPVLPTVKPLVAGSGIDITEEASVVRITNTGNSQVQSDWTQTNSSDPSFIRHKPTLSAVAVSGSYNDLTDKPDIPSQQEQADWTEQDSSSPSYIKHKPSIPSAQIQSDWAQTNSSSVDFIKNKPTLSAVATSGNYSDLNGKPTIPAAQIQSDWNQSDSSQVDFIKNKPAQMQTKPLVAGTNMEFVVGADSVTLNATSNVFVATYGTTTWNEVKAAYDADKVIVLDGANFGTNVHTQMVLYNYSTTSGATQKFLFAPTFYRVSAAQTSYWAQLDENDGWSSGYRTDHFPNVNAGVKQLSGDETFTALVEHRGWLCNRVGFFNIGYFSSASACTVYIEAVNGGFTFDLVGMKRTIRNDLKAAIDLTTTVQSLVTSIDVQTRVVSTGNTINSSSSPRFTLFSLGPQEQSNFDTDIIYEVQLLDSTNGRSYLLKVEKFGVPSTGHNYICATLAGGDLF